MLAGALPILMFVWGLPDAPGKETGATGTRGVVVGT